MSKLASEPLCSALDGRRIPDGEAHAMLQDAASDPLPLMHAASALRDRSKGRTVTFSKKAFFDVVNLCRDTCTYCTYKSEPGQQKLSMMGAAAVRGLLALARRYGCIEALLVAGERPEERYAEARTWLAREGFESTAGYLAHVSGEALDAGLLPHTNAGNLAYSELRSLRETNASVGLMLENSSPRLSGPGMPHRLAPSKEPGARIGVLRDAGRLGIPTTTGLLVGIGETDREALDSLLEIRRLHERYGHIQEVILQNFQPKPDTAMRGHAPGGGARLALMVALCRVLMPAMNIQIPPNLSPGSYRGFLGAGINDLGGISPLTPDHVNPEFPWPRIGELEGGIGQDGFGLACRFPVYPEFAGMVGGRPGRMISEMSDGRGLVRGELWR